MKPVELVKVRQHIIDVFGIRVNTGWKNPIDYPEGPDRASV